MAVAMSKKGGADSPLLQVLSEAETSHSRRLRGDKVAAGDWPAETVLAPLPIGKVVQPPVRSDFLDLRRTFATLGRDELSGYVHLTGDGVQAAALLAGGGVVAAVCEADGAVSSGTEAFSRIRRAVDSGEGCVEIIDLPRVVLSAAQQLLAGPIVYEGLRGRFVRGAEFIDYMSEQTLTGGIHVKSGGRHGVVLLHDGVIGAYTSRNRKPVDSLDLVMSLLEDPDCEISVNGGQVGATLPLMIL
jgi:hypothetical protein